MIRLDLNHCIQFSGYFVYLAMLCLGIYFINEGAVLERFQMKRTNFAESNERVNELPTILANIEYQHPYPNKLLDYGTDFNISYQVFGSGAAVNLTSGRNSLLESELIVDFEKQSEYDYNHTTKRQVGLNFQDEFLFHARCII